MGQIKQPISKALDLDLDLDSGTQQSDSVIFSNYIPL